MNNGNFYLGIDIGGTKCALVVGNKEEQILERIEIASGRDIEPDVLINSLISHAKKLISKYTSEEHKFVSVGISCGGPLDSNTGVIYSPPNLPLWDAIPLVDILEKALGLPTYIHNDANACAIAEWQFGNGRGFNNVIFLTFGTGLGAGLILNGELYIGTNGMAGEVGHIRLSETGPEGFNKAGSFEGYCSGGGIKNLAEIVVQEAFEKGKSTMLVKNAEEIKAITAKDVFAKAQQGDEIALNIVDICAENLGKGLSILVDILNPECIVIGSIYTRCEDMLRDKMYEIMKKETLEEALSKCVVRPSYLKDSVGDYAALTVAILNENRKEVN